MSVSGECESEVLTSPNYDAAYKTISPSTMAKAKWKDLRNSVMMRSNIRRTLRQIHQDRDVWTRVIENEKLNVALSSEAHEEMGSGGSASPKSMRLWCHVHDVNYPVKHGEDSTPHNFPLTNSPNRIIPISVGEGQQDFRWLSSTAVRIFHRGYKANGRLRQRELRVGEGGGACHLPKSVYVVDKRAESEKVEAEALEILEAMRTPKSAEIKKIFEYTKLALVLQDGDHVWIHHQAGKPLGLFAGNRDRMMKIDVFRKNAMSKKPVETVPQEAVECIKINEGSEAAEEVEEVFDLSTSVFSGRARVADSKSFFDSDKFYLSVCEADLFYCERLESVVGGKEEWDAIKMALKTSYRFIREAFRASVASSTTSTMEMTWLDFTTFAKKCELFKDEDSDDAFVIRDLDDIWITVNCHVGNEAVDEHHVRYLSRFEFMEALVRIAIRKYDKMSPRTAVQVILNNHIIPHFKDFDSNQFRKAHLYLGETHDIFEKYISSLRLAFDAFSACDQSCNVPGSRASMNENEFMEMLSCGQVIGPNFSRNDARTAFVFSQSTIIDEFKRSRRASIRDDHRTLSFEEMLEALARVAQTIALGTDGHDVNLRSSQLKTKASESLTMMERNQQKGLSGTLFDENTTQTSFPHRLDYFLSTLLRELNL